MYTTYDGSNSIIFNGVDSWEEWGLVPASRPVVVMPDVRTNTVEIPGMNGVLDLSDVPLGYSTFGNRKGSWTFNVAHDKLDYTWDVLYSKLATALHGKKAQCILKEDKSFYYEGRLTLGEYKPGNTFSTVTIKYDLAPYKRMIWTTLEDWLWNPFDFVNGVIVQSSFKDLPVVDGETLKMEYTQDYVGMAPVCPTFYVTSTTLGATMHMKYRNTGISETWKEVDLKDGMNIDPTIEFMCPTQNSKTEVWFTGAGTVSIEFRPGRL